MVRRILGILGASAFLVLGCNDHRSATEPDPARLPVVTSAKPVLDGHGNWQITGARFGPDPSATFESRGRLIGLVNAYGGDSFVVGQLPPATPSGAYTPCVRNTFGKACGQFTVPVD